LQNAPKAGIKTLTADFVLDALRLSSKSNSKNENIFIKKK
jgi:hypothetical protein